VTVNGRKFRNYSDYPRNHRGTITFRTALAQSCNTAFIGRSIPGADACCRASWPTLCPPRRPLAAILSGHSEGCSALAAATRHPRKLTLPRTSRNRWRPLYVTSLTPMSKVAELSTGHVTVTETIIWN
jgi:hypothetical protein